MNTKKRWFYICLAAVNCAALIAFAVLAAVFCGVTGELSSQKAAERWNADGSSRSAQVSVFYAKTAAIGIDDVYTMRVNIEKKLTENSVTPTNENARIWFDAYSALDSINVSSSREDYTIRVDTELIATGGDYFMFHPLKLRSGYYYSDDDLMKDRVVLDENLAWQLFGSYNVDGMTVLINGKRFYVAGVAEADSDKASEYVYGTKPHMYMSYDGYKQLLSDGAAGITTYEACIPNPVSGLAESIIEEVAAGSDDTMKIVENSDRYSFKKLYSIAFDGGKRAVIDSAVQYPFWENAARITEDKAAGILAAATFVLGVPLFTVVYFLWLLYHNRRLIASKAVDGIRRIFYNIKRDKKSAPDAKGAKQN